MDRKIDIDEMEVELGMLRLLVEVLLQESDFTNDQISVLRSRARRESRKMQLELRAIDEAFEVERAAIEAEVEAELAADDEAERLGLPRLEGWSTPKKIAS